ncbi:MAG: methylenetetrahydrofolate reductase C-terminal domain-containing protein [Thermoguttaceae bacterium]
MLVSEMKPTAEILSLLEGVGRIYLVGCNGCADVCKTGGPEVTAAAARTLAEHGKTVAGLTNVDFLCNKVLTGTRLVRQAERLNGAEGVLVFSCGVGVQVVAAVVDRPVFPAANTLSMGGAFGLWPGAEKCGQCGDCLLGYTGGICPIVGCAKGLVNGPCGGTTDLGECEVEAGRPCAWAQIYQRLKTVGRLDLLRKIVPPRDKSKLQPSVATRRSLFWAIDQQVASQSPKG